MTESSLRVLLITHGLPPESVGGVEQHVDGLARALVAAGHDVHVYAKSAAPGAPQGSLTTLPPSAGTPYATTRFVYRYEGLTSLRSLYEVPELDDALRRFLSGHRFDVAHVHHLTGVSTTALSVLRDRGLPTVLSLHDYWLLCPRGQMWHRDGSVTEAVDPARCADCLRPTFGGWIPPGAEGERVVAELHERAKAVLALPDALVLPSAQAQPPYLALGLPASRLVVIENGVDTEALRGLPPPVAEAGRPLRIGYLGTLIPSKGLDVLIDAYRRLPAGAAELRIFGNATPYHGDDGFLTRGFARLTPADRVVYHGPYATADLPRILAGLDVVAAPARWREAFGLTVREALAAARPVVASRIGGLADSLVDGVHGALVPPGDVAALAAVLARWCADRDAIAAMAAACRASAPVRGFDAMAAELIALYHSVASRP